MQRLESVVVIVSQDATGRPYVQIESESMRQTLWAESVSVIDRRPKEKT